DILVGKISPLRFLGIAKEIRMGIENFRDNSLHLEEIHDGFVEKIILTTNEEGNILLKITVRDTRIPEVGDKLATRHGQKGVIGLVVPEEDMPFTAEGITPDIIINSHAIPSRMTVGQILEILEGKAAALNGTHIDATAFKSSEEEPRKILADNGFQDDGKESLYNGITGEKMESKILIGMCYYQRLYHIVSKKIHARAKGPVALLTKQPTAGRSKGGGLRLGGMEKDCFIAHGAPIVLQERFSSDSVKEHICTECGTIAVKDHIKNKVVCLNCKSEENIEVRLSYAFKLLLDEMKSMMIAASIKTTKD
ncbi:MAG: DNA-directed RNA polymerase subunit B, partial [Candidatus Aenigmarchaeota archaeon]|nr:DNA-directed RNA polymerase subunit B [Candidatus Aenigmarchaeota archaeon]